MKETREHLELRLQMHRQELQKLKQQAHDINHQMSDEQTVIYKLEKELKDTTNGTE